MRVNGRIPWSASSQRVGWVERFAKPIIRKLELMGIAAAAPPILRIVANRKRRAFARRSVSMDARVKPGHDN
jgi:hypothetical protein